MISRRTLLFGNPDSTAPVTDVVVVGAGFAGLAAALGAVERQARVILVDRATDLYFAPSREGSLYFNAVAPERQVEQGIVDSPELFYRQTLSHGLWRADPKLVKQLCYNAYIVLKWLERMGIVFEPKVQQVPGGAFARTCIAAHPQTCRMTLLKACDRLGVTVIQGMQFQKLLIEKPNRVTGIVVKDMHGEEHEITANAVILTTGGFVSNSEMCARHDPRLKDLHDIHYGRAQGDGLEEAVKAGAYLVGMDYIELMLGHWFEDHFYRNAMHPLRYMLVDETGRRVVNEEKRDAVDQAILNRRDKTLYLVTSYKELEVVPKADRKKLEAFLQKRFAVRVTDEESLHRILPQCDWVFWQKGLEEYNTQETDRFGKSWRYPIDGNDALVVPVTLARTATLGGLHIDEAGHVLNAFDTPIEGLFAAGEITGGVHGAHCLIGNLVLDSVLFGREAGLTAAG